jgi:UrcA family protein
MKRTLIAGLFALASFAAFAQPAAAETRSDRDRLVEKVQTADLDLTRQAGAATLERRLRATAQRLCHRPTHPGNLVYWSAYRACLRETLEEAVAQVDAPLVLARFEDIRRGRTIVTASVQ